MATRLEHADEVGSKLTAALTYPAIVSLAALAVVLFLSNKTLPDLTGLLVDAQVEIPRLTALVMGLGQWLLRAGPLLLLSFGVSIALGAFAIVTWVHRSEAFARRLTAWVPQVLRAKAVAALSRGLADLLAAGVPLTQALRVLSPTLPRLLSRAIDRAIERLQGGEELSLALAADPLWFSPEFRRLLASAQATGELEPLLRRIAARYERQAKRLTDRLAALLEPAAIVVLAALVGTVVMAAVLPLVRLQEIVG